MNYKLVAIMTLAFVTLLSTPVGAVDATINDGDRYWVGQDLEYNVHENSSDAELVINDDNVSVPFVTELSISNEGNITIDTSGYDQQSYKIIYDNESDIQKTVNFTLTELSFEPNFGEDSVNNKINTDVSLDYNDTRENYQINVTSDDLDDDKLADVFGKSSSDVLDDNLTINDSLDEVNFEDIPSDTYEFKFNVTDVNITRTESIEVTSGDADGSLKFNETTYRSSRGSKVHISVEFNGSNTANIVIGDEDKTGYAMNFTVKDTEDEGEVDIVFNTFKAGKNQSKNTVYVHEDSNGDVIINNETEIGVNRLAALNYGMTGYVGDTPAAYSTIILSNSSVRDVSAYSIPSDESVDNIEDINELIEEPNEFIAENDTLVIKSEIGGVYSFLDESTNLDQDPDKLNGLYLDVYSKSPNSDNYAKLNDSNVYVDSKNGSFYVVETVSEPEFEIGEKYNIELGLTEDSPYIDSENDEFEQNDYEVSTSINVEERSTEFINLDNEDYLKIQDSENKSIVADTNIAEGSERVAIVKRTNVNESDIFTYDVVVKNGQFRFNLNESFNEGDNFTIRIIDETDIIDAKIIEKTNIEDDKDEESEEDTNETNEQNNTDDNNKDEESEEDTNETNEQNNTDDNNKDEESENSNNGVLSYIISLFESLL